MTAEELASVTIEHLRAIRATQADHGERFGRIESRLSNLEVTVAGMRRDLAHMYGEVVEQHASYDRLASRIDRLERRLELREG
jgi:uncharacterized coiled-coil protein SlyX